MKVSSHNGSALDHHTEAQKHNEAALDRVRRVLIKFEHDPEFQNWIAVKRLAASLNKRVIGREG